MIVEVLAVAIGVGLAISLLFSELFGLAAGGMVVPGYFALYLNKPMDVILTLLAALATYMVVYLFSNVVIVYGKRRTVLMILVGYIIRMMVDWLPLASLQTSPLGEVARGDFVIIGYIIPGLIAIWLDRQGVVETLSSLLTAAVVVRLILIIVLGTDFIV